MIVVIIFFSDVHQDIHWLNTSRRTKTLKTKLKIIPFWKPNL